MKIQEISEQNIKQVQKEFDLYQKQNFPERSPEFFCLELNGEAGELANLEKKLWKGKDISIESVGDEAADVFIALMNYSNAREIDLGYYISQKLKKIEEKRILLKQNGEEY